MGLGGERPEMGRPERDAAKAQSVELSDPPERTDAVRADDAVLRLAIIFLRSNTDLTSKGKRSGKSRYGWMSQMSSLRQTGHADSGKKRSLMVNSRTGSVCGSEIGRAHV